jgi:3D (Asp-Asp-Asp) domain-containing protein
MPWVGSCDVHKVSKTNSTPLIPFGTTVSYLNRSVTIGGTSYSAFVVNDTGDASFKRSSYWTDIYFGDNTTTNYKAAINYGIKQDVTLYWLR